MNERYAKYRELKFDFPQPRVLRITIASTMKMNAMTATLHRECSQVWKDVDDDPEVSVAIITGSPQAFSAGGDLNHERKACEDYAIRMQAMKESRDLVYNIINCSKPIVSAVQGWAVGAGIACVLLADISVVAKDAKFSDGHAKIGVAAGDHAAIIWPLLCGMARAKYYLLLSESFTGQEAADMGLVSLAVESDQVQAKALEIAQRLASLAPAATRWTKQTLNHWLRQAGPIFDASLALEFIGFAGPEGIEGIDAFLQKRPPKFPTDAPS
jgi:enoyl-CoA hydratase